MILTTAAIISLLIWIYLAFAQGGFWRISKFMLSDKRPSGSEPLVAVVVPARDEADVIAPCIASLLQQRGIRVHVFLIDDASQDGTANVAAHAAESIAKADQLTVISGLPLPAGWSGKLWAVQQGIERASRLNPEYLLLTDADILHPPDHIQSLIARAESGSYDLASVMVRLHCKTFAERSLIPAFVFFFLMLYPPAWISDPRRKPAGAAGGCILICPQALTNAGGITAIRNEIIDDCALALRVKQSGGRVWLGLSTAACSIRPYKSVSAIGSMISRTAFNQLRHSVFLLLFSLLGLTVAYLLPPLLLLSGHLISAFLGLAAWLLMSVCFLPTVRLYHLNPLWSLALPGIAVFYMGATLHSAFRFWQGKGGAWKGRMQDPAHT